MRSTRVKAFIFTTPSYEYQLAHLLQPKQTQQPVEYLLGRFETSDIDSALNFTTKTSSMETLYSHKSLPMTK